MNYNVNLLMLILATLNTAFILINPYKKRTLF